MNRRSVADRLFHQVAHTVVLAAFALPALGLSFSSPVAAQNPPAAAPRVLGTVQSISGNSITVLADSGTTASISVEDATRLLQIEPGKTDLKEATPLALSDLQPGDRVLVRGVMAGDGKTLRAASLIAMKKAAISDKQAKERAEWQRGVGGLVKSIDTSGLTIVLTTNGISSSKEVVLHLTKETVLRRYAPGSVRFDAAKAAPLSAIQVGDQLRARGARQADPANFDAAEVVSGSFRNIAGTVSSVDASSNTVVVQDLALKAPVTLKITAESQMRKLPPPFAERLAARLKGQPSDAGTPGPPQGGALKAQDAPGGTAPGGVAQGGGAQGPAGQSAAAQGGAGSGPSGAPGGGAGRAGAAGGDFQQMIARLPASTLADLQKGDAVMVVATEGNGKDPVTVITLLGGVDPLLRAKGGQDMILSPWSLGGGEPSAN